MLTPYFYAHTLENNRDPAHWQLLEDHLYGVAEKAADFAEAFSAREWGYLAGLWHDLGKYSEAFQKKIIAVSEAEASLEAKSKVDHSTAGALLAVRRFEKSGRILAYPVAGHHAGLPDWQNESSGSAGLAQRLRKTELLEKIPLPSIPAEIRDRALPTEKPKHGSDLALWIRMLFSCVVDADFLDTEAFLQPEKSQVRGQYPALPELLAKFNEYMEDKISGAKDTSVNRLRGRILQQCFSKASCPPGIFTLTVPTGGGKTLSSMAFALNHAVKYEKRRVIYVIPYTSIIEQTADQFRDVFSESVIEHHSNLDTSQEEDETSKSRLASENWDAPIIVTTSVQFFESLFASRTSRCRKLHNIVNSVVVLDEVQLLPPEFLNPILAFLKELQRNYDITVVMSTATQPAFEPQKSIDFDFAGLPDTVEIMEDPLSLHRDLKRVEVQIPDDLNIPESWEDLSSKLQQHPTVLCIVNRRDDCRILHQMMPEGTIHLSALMCGAHRSEVIDGIKQRLEKKIPTRVISTQLVEAGVDFDFPVVYRALAGLDSIAQAAGRCNREGSLEKGQVLIFIPPSKVPPGHLRQAAEIGRRLLGQETNDPLAPDHFERFFRELYWLKGQGLDAKDIMADIAKDTELRFSFRTAAGKFHLINESLQSPVLVRYGDGKELIDLLARIGPERWLLRKLQRYVVNLPRYLHSRLVAEGGISQVSPGVYIQAHGNLYDTDLGFCADKSLIYDPDELIT